MPPMPVASTASVTMMPSTWPRRAPIAFRSPSSLRRSVTMAENSTLTISAVLANISTIRARMPSSSAASPWRMPDSVVSPATTFTPFTFDRMAKRACSGVAPGASSARKPRHLARRQHGGLGAVAAAIPPPIASPSASSVAKDMNTPRSWVPTPVRPSRP